MKISVNWLTELVPFSMSVNELAERLTMVGLEVEEMRTQGGAFEGVVVGEVLSVEKHPHADKLHVCQVDVGNETLSIVCGAPNVAAGQVVPVARIGAKLPGGVVIQAVTLRGVTSYGMICSEKELGLGDSHEGILVLDPTRYVKGALFDDGSIGKRDTLFEINVTPNRPDCLSHIGVAREVGLLANSAVVLPDSEVPEGDSPVDEWIEVKIQESSACPRYTARIIRNVSVGPSPAWLRNRLEALGLRSINNVVDVTNLILFETGHPLHAFDYDRIADHKILVRYAKEGEAFTTLDGKTHRLASNDLLICDGRGGVALAGIMGGENSEVTENTRHILLESAYFDPKTIRKTAKRLGMSTEASQRFERGCDPNGTVYAINRAARLIAELTGGIVAKGCVDVYPHPIQPREICLRTERIALLLGMDVPKNETIRILTGLGLEVMDGSPLKVRVPTFRPDLQKEVDLIEEVIRHYGLDRVPTRFETRLVLTPEVDRRLEFIESLRDFMVGQGFCEAITHSMVSIRAIRLFESRPAVAIQNPLSPETAYLRNSLIPGLLDAIVWNQNRFQSNLKLFELGRLFVQTNEPLPLEQEALAAVFFGETRPSPFWGAPSIPFGFYHLKGMIEALISRFHAEEVGLVSTPSPIFTETTSMSMMRGEKTIGLFGEIREDILKAWDIKGSVFAVELFISEFQGAIPQSRRYRPVSKFPLVRRDLSIVVDESIPADRVASLIREAGGAYLVSVDLFDLYRGDSIPSGKKSLSYTLTFVSHDRTLVDQDIDPLIENILRHLEKMIHAKLRE